MEDDAIAEPAKVVALMADALARHPQFALDYAAVADPDTIRTPEAIEGEVRLLIAARLGRARLIDNVAANPPSDQD